MNPLCKPAPAHPWRNPIPAKSQERARAGTRALRLAFHDARGGAEGLQGFHVTHLLVYEGQELGRMYRHRGVYYTLEQWTHSDYGLRKTDLREGERFVKV